MIIIITLIAKFYAATLNSKNHRPNISHLHKQFILPTATSFKTIHEEKGKLKSLPAFIFLKQYAHIWYCAGAKL